MIKNCVRCLSGAVHEIGYDEGGLPFTIHDPFPCACGAPACYGEDSVWYCLECWSRHWSETHK